MAVHFLLITIDALELVTGDVIRVRLGDIVLANSKDTYLPHDIAESMVSPSITKTRDLGFFITNKYGDETPGGKYFMQGGSNQGYLAIFVASKSQHGDGVVIMVNVSPDYNSKDV